MNDHRKNAYRYLLYQAMLDIRGVEWTLHEPLKLINPLELRRRLRRAVEAGALANRLHNLALAAAIDFVNFDEHAFWSHQDAFMRRFPGVADHHLQVFERELARAV